MEATAQFYLLRRSVRAPVRKGAAGVLWSLVRSELQTMSVPKSCFFLNDLCFFSFPDFSVLVSRDEVLNH